MSLQIIFSNELKNLLIKAGVLHEEEIASKPYFDLDDLEKFYLDLQTLANNPACPIDKKMIIEKAKLALMQCLENNLKNNDSDENSHRPVSKISRLKLIFFSYVLLSIPDGFNDIGNVLDTIPDVPDIAFLSLGGLFSFLELALYVWVEMRMISHELDVPFYKLKGLLQIFHSQIDLLDSLQANLLRHANHPQLISLEDLTKCQSLLEMFHTDLLAKQKLLIKSKTTQNSTGLKFCKILTGTFVTLVYGFDRYFTAHALFLLIFASVAIAHPWIPIVAGIGYALLKLVPYILLKLRGLSRAINHLAGAPNDLLKKFRRSNQKLTEQNQNIKSALQFHIHTEKTRQELASNFKKIAHNDRIIKLRPNQETAHITPSNHRIMLILSKEIHHFKHKLEQQDADDLKNILTIQEGLIGKQQAFIALQKKATHLEEKLIPAVKPKATPFSPPISSTPRLISVGKLAERDSSQRCLASVLKQQGLFRKSKPAQIPSRPRSQSLPQMSFKDVV